MKEKQKYVRPAIQVYNLRQKPLLLAGSTGEGGLPGYPGNGDNL